MKKLGDIQDEINGLLSYKEKLTRDRKKEDQEIAEKISNLQDEKNELLLLSNGLRPGDKILVTERIMKTYETLKQWQYLYEGQELEIGSGFRNSSFPFSVGYYNKDGIFEPFIFVGISALIEMRSAWELAFLGIKR